MYLGMNYLSSYKQFPHHEPSLPQNWVMLEKDLPLYVKTTITILCIFMSEGKDQ